MPTMNPGRNRTVSFAQQLDRKRRHLNLKEQEEARKILQKRLSSSNYKPFQIAPNTQSGQSYMGMLSHQLQFQPEALAMMMLVQEFLSLIKITYALSGMKLAFQDLPQWQAAYNNDLAQRHQKEAAFDQLTTQIEQKRAELLDRADEFKSALDGYTSIEDMKLKVKALNESKYKHETDQIANNDQRHASAITRLSQQAQDLTTKIKLLETKQQLEQDISNLEKQLSDLDQKYPEKSFNPADYPYPEGDDTNDINQRRLTEEKLSKRNIFEVQSWHPLQLDYSKRIVDPRFATTDVLIANGLIPRPDHMLSIRQTTIEEMITILGFTPDPLFHAVKQMESQGKHGAQQNHDDDPAIANMMRPRAVPVKAG